MLALLASLNFFVISSLLLCLFPLLFNKVNFPEEANLANNFIL